MDRYVRTSSACCGWHDADASIHSLFETYAWCFWKSGFAHPKALHTKAGGEVGLFATRSLVKNTYIWDAIGLPATDHDECMDEQFSDVFQFTDNSTGVTSTLVGPLRFLKPLCEDCEVCAKKATNCQVCNYVVQSWYAY